MLNYGIRRSPVSRGLSATARAWVRRCSGLRGRRVSRGNVIGKNDEGEEDSIRRGKD